MKARLFQLVASQIDINYITEYGDTQATRVLYNKRSVSGYGPTFRL